MPLDERTWEGVFSSTMYPPLLGVIPRVCGRLTVAGDTAVLQYTGMYRRGQRSTMALDAARASGTQPGVASSSFGGACATTLQTVSFVVLTRAADEVTGTYSSVNPLDAGTIRLRAVAR